MTHDPLFSFSPFFSFLKQEAAGRFRRFFAVVFIFCRNQEFLNWKEIGWKIVSIFSIFCHIFSKPHSKSRCILTTVPKSVTACGHHCRAQKKPLSFGRQTKNSSLSGVYIEKSSRSQTERLLSLFVVLITAGAAFP